MLNVPIESDIQGFDPAIITDNYTMVALEQVYQGLTQYDYYARPYKVVPLLVKSMPTISPDRLVYTFQLREDVFFHEDPAFGGKPRKLTASDVVYSLKRIADPRVKSPNWWMLEGRIVGLDEFRVALGKAKGTPNYDSSRVAGLSAPDDKTVVIKLIKPYRQLLYILALHPFGVLSPEVVAKYGDELINHPVGTGPYVLKEWIRGQRIGFSKNEKYWKEIDSRTGRQLPEPDEINLWIYPETQPMWLNFLKGNLDVLDVVSELQDLVFQKDGTAVPELKRRQIEPTVFERVDTVFLGFQMQDKIVGSNKYLRQAISAAIDRNELIKLFWSVKDREAHGPIAPGVFGYNEDLRNPYGYDLDHARRLIEKAKQAAGVRTFPPIKLHLMSSSWHRQLGEALGQQLRKIGLNLNVELHPWPRLQELMEKRQVQMFLYSWTADYPDAENFLQLFYGPNAAPATNRSCFQNSGFDSLYKEIQADEDSPERKERINRVVQIIMEEMPLIPLVHRSAPRAVQGWVSNFRLNPFARGGYKYVVVDAKRKVSLAARK
ncbi:MAG TPA: ABC transporter substrate-binding protein [Bdellovibrionota bacterium]|nr:ABC transporter substrate-binding protein [Bdellovibrionota bacterium]